MPFNLKTRETENRFFYFSKAIIKLLESGLIKYYPLALNQIRIAIRFS